MDIIPSVLSVVASTDLDVSKDLESTTSKTIAQILEDTNIDDKKENNK